jgi:hypothetical protein
MISADRARKLRPDYPEILSGFPQSLQSNAGRSVLKQVATTSFQTITNSSFINLLAVQSKFLVEKTLKARELLQDLGVDGWIIFKPGSTTVQFRTRRRRREGEEKKE